MTEQSYDRLVHAWRPTDPLDRFWQQVAVDEKARERAEPETWDGSMTAVDHYRAAERLLAEVSQHAEWNGLHQNLAAAQAHATLALAGATALARFTENGMPDADRNEWRLAASEAPKAAERQRASERAERQEFRDDT